jgi:hypothetical protein
MNKRSSHNLNRNRLTERPIRLSAAANAAGLREKPIRISHLWSRLVAAPLSPAISVEPTSDVTTPDVQQTQIAITDPGAGTARSADELTLSTFRDGRVLGHDLFRSPAKTVRVNATFERGASFFLRVGARNDAGSSLSEQTVMFPKHTEPSEPVERPDIEFDVTTLRLTGSGFQPNDTVFIRVGIAGRFGVRDSSQLPGGSLGLSSYHRTAMDVLRGCSRRLLPGCVPRDGNRLV